MNFLWIKQDVHKVQDVERGYNFSKKKEKKKSFLHKAKGDLAVWANNFNELIIKSAAGCIARKVGDG